jgi:basic amino acid/polyamine antiporter, APA family
MASPGGEASLDRRLGTGDAVIVGLAAMIGAGVFAAPGPAAAAAGSWLLAGLGLAALVAYANATSSAQLAALYPEAGGTYVYARVRLGPYWGFLAGWSFVVGKTASLSAMALTFGAYVAPDLARPLAIGAVVVLATVNVLGVEKTARLSRWIVAVVLGALAVTVAAALFGGQAAVGNLTGDLPAGPLGILQAGGLLFFAFAGYARLATLGEEVVDPQTTIPRAIPLALGIVVVVYAAVLTLRCWWSGRPCLRPPRRPWRLPSRQDDGRPWLPSCASGLPWRRPACCCRCWPASAARPWRWPDGVNSPGSSTPCTLGTGHRTERRSWRQPSSAGS